MKSARQISSNCNNKTAVSRAALPAAKSAFVFVYSFIAKLFRASARMVVFSIPIHYDDDDGNDNEV